MWALLPEKCPYLAVIMTAGHLLLPVAAQSQFVVSSRAGLISYTDGRVVLLNPTDEQDELDPFHHVSTGGRLLTKDGRAEMILSPNRLLRLDKFTEIELLSDDITDGQVGILSGSVICDLMRLPKRHSITVFIDQAKLEFLKRGLYRVDIGFDGTAELSVLCGKALVSLGDFEGEAGPNRRMRLTSGSSPTELDDFRGGEFYAWHRKRAQLISEARRRGQKLEVARKRTQQDNVNAGTSLYTIPGILGTPQRPITTQ